MWWEEIITGPVINVSNEIYIIFKYETVGYREDKKIIN